MFFIDKYAVNEELTYDILSSITLIGDSARELVQQGGGNGSGNS